MFKRTLLAASFLIASAAAAFAQSGQLGAGQVLGNSTSTGRNAAPENVTAILDRALGATRGAIIERGSSGWAIVGPGATTGLPWVSNGAGADPAYQFLTAGGGGTGQTTYTIGDLLIATATGTLSRLADVATGNALIAGGVGVAPVWGKITSAHITGNALTKTDDTNVTMTLGGTPASALVNAASLTLGWTGQLAIARGGTGQATAAAGISALMPTPTRAGDVAFWNGSNWVTLAGNNSGSQVFTENASGVPSWTAPGTGTVTTSGSPAAGQVSQFTAALVIQGVATSSLLTPGNGIGVTNTAPTATITATLSSFTNAMGADTVLTASMATLAQVAQGTGSGTFSVTANVSFRDTAAANTVTCQITDGTTALDGRAATSPAANLLQTIALSGYSTNPAGNLRLQCKNTGGGGTTSALFNFSGNGFDTSIRATRIAN